MTDNTETLRLFMRDVWNAGDATAVDRFLAEFYIHSDPGDPGDAVGSTKSPADDA